MKTRWRTQKLRIFLLLAISLGLILAVYGYIVFLSPALVRHIENGAASIKNRGLVSNENDQAYTVIKRKNIYDLNLKELALSFLIASVYVKPLELQGDQGAIEKLSEVLEIEGETLRKKVASEKSFVWVARNVPRERAEKIRQFHLAGVYLTKEEVRLYPNGRQGGHLIGFAKGQQGLAGVESYYDSVLIGKSEFEVDNLKAAGISESQILSGNGASLILSLDLRLQSYLENKLALLLERSAARSAMAIIMEPDSGEILAMANNPDYDPNFFWRTVDFQRRNRAVSDPVRGGGLLKAFRMIAELASGNIPDFILNSEEISRKVIFPRLYKRIVSTGLKRQVNSYWQELSEGAYWSGSESDFVYRLTEKELAAFSRSYGLSGSLPIDLPNSVSDLAIKSSENFSLTDGRSSTTALHLVTAFSRLLNGGKQVTPHILKAVWLEEKGDRIPARFSTGKKVIDLAVKRHVIRLFNELTPTSFSRGIFVESITPDVDEEGTGQLEVSNSSLGQEVAVADMESMLPAKMRYSNVMLGAVPAQNPKIALVLVLDGAVVDPSVNSSNKKVVEDIMTKALVWRKIVKTNNTPDSRLQEKELFAKWNKLHMAGEQVGLMPEDRRHKMPKLKGVSLRSALQLLQDYDLQIRVVGSGGVIGQHPAAGEYFEPGSDCFLELAYK